MIDKLAEAAGDGSAAGSLLGGDLGFESSETLGTQPMPPAAASESGPFGIRGLETTIGDDGSSGAGSLAGTTFQMGAAGGSSSNRVQ